MTRPSLTITQPTAGFGQTLPRPRRASPSAACISARSRPLSISPDALPRASASIVIRGDPADELAEILGFAEISGDRGEADVGDLVEGRQRLHHEFADHVARHLGLAGAFELAHQRVDHPLDPVGFDRPLAQRDIDRAGELVAVERLALAVLLHYGQFAQLHPLE